MTVRTCKPLLLDRLQTRICMKRIKTYHSLRIFFFFGVAQHRRERKKKEIRFNVAPLNASKDGDGMGKKSEKEKERKNGPPM